MPNLVAYFRAIDMTLGIIASTTSCSVQPFSNGFYYRVKYFNENVAYVSSMYGTLLKTSNNGLNWISIGPYFSSTILSISFCSLDIGYILGYHGTILKTTTGGEPIGIQPISTEIPKQFILHQNYPNPFNPVTKIKFEIPAVGQRHSASGGFDVRLVIYDILGREVAVPVSKNMKAGSYTVDFDGSGLSSGVYIYRIEAGRFSDAKKMILIK